MDTVALPLALLPRGFPQVRVNARVEKSAPFKSQLTVCWPKLSDTPGSAKQTVHYFCRLVKGADFSPPSHGADHSTVRAAPSVTPSSTH